MLFEQRYNALCPANDSRESIFIPENGIEIYLEEIGGCAAYTSGVKVEIFWNNELIFVTHGSVMQRTYLELVGDGAKELKIKFSNSTLFDETLNGYVLGQSNA